MKAVFADTFYWAALTSTEDSSHVRALGNTVTPFFANSRVQVIPQTRDSFLNGLELYRARPDKGYSLTDCISMQTMRREGLTDDRHFEQEGFRALFRHS